MKIEPGCRAVIVNSRAGKDGKIVTVGENLGWPIINGDQREGSKHFGDRWEIDIPIKSIKGAVYNHVGEKQLKRIDDDSRQVTSWESLKDIFIPNDLKESTC